MWVDPNSRWHKDGVLPVNSRTLADWALGYERFQDKPHKTERSHVGDAFGYVMMGGGEHKYITRGKTPAGARGGAK